MDLSTTVETFEATVNYGSFLLKVPEFYLAGMALMWGSAFCVLLLKAPSTPKGREILRVRKGWAVPLLLTACLGFGLWGFYTLGLPELQWFHLWGTLIMAGYFFLLLRFPRILGIPLGTAGILLVTVLVLGLQGWHPIVPEGKVALARPMPENHWELKKAGGSSLVPEEMFPGEVWLISTPGFLSLTGSSWWINWHNPGTDGFLETVHGLTAALGFEKRLQVPLPPKPVLYYPSQLVFSESWAVDWVPGL